MIIRESNRDRIQSIIDEVQKRSREREICYNDIEKYVGILEEKLDIPKKDMEGVVAHIDIHAQDFPRAYQYKASSTHFIVERKKSGWNLADVFRQDTRGENSRFLVTLTDAAKQKIIESHERFRF